MRTIVQLAALTLCFSCGATVRRRPADDRAVGGDGSSNSTAPAAARAVAGPMAPVVIPGAVPPGRYLRRRGRWRINGWCDRWNIGGSTGGSTGEAVRVAVEVFVCGDADGDGCDDRTIEASPNPNNDGWDYDGDGQCEIALDPHLSSRRNGSDGSSARKPACCSPWPTWTVRFTDETDGAHRLSGTRTCGRSQMGMSRHVCTRLLRTPPRVWVLLSAPPPWVSISVGRKHPHVDQPVQRPLRLYG